jgi:hypothetical protein
LLLLVFTSILSSYFFIHLSFFLSSLELNQCHSCFDAKLSEQPAEQRKITVVVDANNNGNVVEKADGARIADIFGCNGGITWFSDLLVCVSKGWLQ